MKNKGLLFCVAALTALAAMRPVGAQQSVPPGMCRVSGAVSSSGTPIPGVAMLAKAGNTTVAATSSEADGRFQLIVKPGVYTLSAELRNFRHTSTTDSIVAARSSSPAFMPRAAVPAETGSISPISSSDCRSRQASTTGPGTSP